PGSRRSWRARWVLAGGDTRSGGGHVVFGAGVGERAVVADLEGDDAVGAGGEHVQVPAVVALCEVERGHAVDRGRAQEGELAGRRDRERRDGRAGGVRDERVAAVLGGGAAGAADAGERNEQMALAVEVEAERGAAGRDVEGLEVGERAVLADEE